MGTMRIGLGTVGIGLGAMRIGLGTMGIGFGAMRRTARETETETRKAMKHE